MRQPYFMTIREFEERKLARRRDDGVFELINGREFEKPPFSMLQGVVAINLAVSIKTYLKTNPGGQVSVKTEHGTSDVFNVRIPDVSYMRSDSVTTAGPVPRMPDLAVEIAPTSLHPGTDAQPIYDRAFYYLSRETELVWILYPGPKKVEVFTSVNVDVLSGGELDGGRALPGYSVSLDVLFETEWSGG